MMSRGKEKIVLVGMLPEPFNGQSVCFQMLVEGIKERGIHAQVINISPKQNNRAAGKWSWRRAFELLTIITVYVFRMFGFDKTVYITIAQSRVGFIRDFIMIWLAKLFKHRVVVHIHGGNYDHFFYNQPYIIKTIIKKTLLQSDAVIVLGEALKSMFNFELRLYNKIQVVPNGLPHDIQSQNDFQEKNWSTKYPFKLLYLSNLIESKGYLDVLEAVDLLVNKHGYKNVIAHFCGDFIQNQDDKRFTSAKYAKEYFFEYIERKRLQNNVKYLGVISGKDKVKELQEANVFLLPTNYDNEGQPVSIIEAMAYGCVVLSTKYRAIPDMLIENENGFYIEHGKPESITGHIVTLISSPFLYNKMSKCSVKLYQQKFTRNAHLNKIVPIICNDRNEKKVR